MSNSTCTGDYIEWIYVAFGDCIVTARDKVSFSIGMVSNCIWLICSIPQIYHNFKTKHVDGQSPFYFSIMVCADSMSLIGAIITHALATQIVTGIIYVTVDIILVTQFTIYGGWPCLKKGKKLLDDNEYQKQNDNIVNQSYTDSNNTNNPVAGTLLATSLIVNAAIDYSFPYRGEYLYGSISGWIGTGLYLFSRVTQLKKNLERKYITDFSPVYIAFIISANATYSLSVFIKSLDPAYLWRQTPWIVGSLGPMCFDIFTAMMMCYYGRTPPSNNDNNRNGNLMSSTTEMSYTNIESNGV